MSLPLFQVAVSLTPPLENGASRRVEVGELGIEASPGVN